MKCLIFGYGQMGKVISYGMERLGYQIHAVDQAWDSNNDTFHYHTYSRDCSNPLEVGKLINEINPDIIISSLPYYCNYTIAEQAVLSKIPYCDLGGHVETSKNINSLGNNFEQDVFTDLGLAPGWINIEAENLYRKAVADDLEVNDVHMFTGGLPQTPNNPLNYELTWSFDGLWNEYIDNCEVLRDYELVSMPGMSGLKPYKSSYESFYTSGGSSHSIRKMQERGVRNCSYNTVRYKGHNKLFKWLAGYLSKEQIKEMIPKTNKDFVRMSVRVGGVLIDTYTDYEWEHCVYSDKEFTAMQKCTAFPLCSVANQMVLNKKNKPWDYSDVNYGDFITDMKVLFKTGDIGRLYVP